METHYTHYTVSHVLNEFCRVFHLRVEVEWCNDALRGAYYNLNEINWTYVHDVGEKAREQTKSDDSE